MLNQQPYIEGMDYFKISPANMFDGISSVGSQIVFDW